MAQESRLVIVIDAKNAERNARNLGNELDSIERKGDFASKSMDALSVATRQLAGYMAGLVTVSAAISKMDTYTGLQNRLKLVTNNQVELNKATEDTFRIAQKTYSAWDSVLQVYQRFSDNAKTLNLTMDETARLTETVSKAVAISGASASAADAALVQFGQALASGTLRGEELNSVMEQTPALAKAIAQGMGITVGELRTVAAEGKITSQEIVKALKNVQNDVDALFAKTDITISQSLTLLNNEITKFVGESGKGSGAAEVLSGSIKTLAGNLDVLTSAMMVGGAYWLGTYIPAIYASGVAVAAKTKELAVQTVTQYAAIQAERAAAAQQVLSTQAVVANTQATLAAIAAEKALEVQRLKSQITEKGRTATLTRMAELKKIEAQVTRELAVAEGALATAQARSAAAGAASVGIGSRLLGLLGGPVGIGITVASLAAGYLLMRDNGDKANDMLEKQSRYAGMAADELMKLEGAQKRAAESELTKQLSLQNAQLSKSQNEFLLLTQSITDNNKQSAEAYRIWAELKTGVIDVNQAFNRLNQLSFISSDQINQLADSKKKVDENTKAVKQTNSELNQVRTSGANAKAGFNDVSQGAKGAGQDVSELNKKLQDLQKTYAQKNLDTDFSLINIKSHGLEMGKALSDFYDNNKIPKTRSLTKDEWAIFQKNFDKVQELKKLEEDIADSKRQQTKELEKQQKVLSVNAKVQANAVKYGFAGIESKNNLPAGTLSAIHAIETGNSGRTDLVNKSTGATGGFQFLAGTAKQYGVKDRYDLAQSAEGAGKYMSYLLKLFKGDLEKAVRAYHAGEGNVQKGKGIGKYNNQYWKDYQGYMAGINGYAAGDITSKDFDRLIQDATKMAEEQAKLRLQLENDVANEVTKIRNDLAKKLEDVDRANFTPERKAEIKAELQSRADNDVAIAQQALKTKLDDYKQFNMTEEQLLKDSFDRKKFNAAHDIELSKNQRDEAIKYLEQQKQQELGLLKLAQEQRLFQAKQALLTETQAMQERYRLEREEILKNTKLSIEERQKLIALSKANQDKETRDKVNNAVQNWDGIQASITGNSGQFALEQERFSRYDASQKVFDSQLADIETQEQDPNANMVALNAQREQIMKEHFERLKLIESTYQNDSMNLQLGYGASVTGALAGMFKNMLGESSSAYRILYESQRAFALAQAGMNMWKAASDAYANEPGTWYQKAAAAAIATIKSGTFVSLIQAATPQGFADGGYTGNGLKHTPAGIVHKGEVVWSQEDIKRWGGVSVVESMRQSKPSGYANGGYVSNNTSEAIAARREARQFDAINSNQTQSSSSQVPINVYVTVNPDGSSKTDTQNDSKQLGQMIGNAVRTIIQQEQRQGGLLSK
ncbi:MULTISPECIES: tape measure protein [Acinetobacter]|uniref:Transglycosylase SLT domain protein n=2 Tax=Gammaproteobacteria TaxID=1236 RepID=A0AAJ0QYW4_ACIBA|nr:MULTISPECIES: tape measure protein [Acinetobacter]EHU1663692.1 tape measure protein [Acinetobacter baumannii]EHU1783170.1 tape measure protein [Acinetobacter baumannii]EHU1858389.1 tape measure protein [Acinetobacter baumannii]EHU1957105.1 tape measure protein [Acinetobacter baumannii]EHU2071171.1 tape measure protein [Acinetobacter baumannii]